MANKLMEVLGRFLDSKQASYTELRSTWQEACAPLPGVSVSWEVIRDIANSLCNQLDLAGDVDMSQAHMSSFNGGPLREFTCEQGRNGFWRDANWDGGGWDAFDEADVSWLRWESLSSGSALAAVKQGPGNWLLTFIPSRKDPLYRGTYFDLYDRAPLAAVKPIAASLLPVSQPVILPPTLTGIEEVGK
jgi:hypothetical protein